MSKAVQIWKQNKNKTKQNKTEKKENKKKLQFLQICFSEKLSMTQKLLGLLKF